MLFASNLGFVFQVRALVFILYLLGLSPGTGFMHGRFLAPSFQETLQHSACYDVAVYIAYNSLSSHALSKKNCLCCELCPPRCPSAGMADIFHHACRYSRLH